MNVAQRKWILNKTAEIIYKYNRDDYSEADAIALVNDIEEITRLSKNNPMCRKLLLDIAECFDLATED